MQFVILGVQYGEGLALRNMGLNLLQYYFLAAVLITQFGNIKVVRHKWRSLWDQKNKD